MAANFENFKISPGFPINFRKSHQISKNYLKSSESYRQKPLVPKDPPGLNRVNGAKIFWSESKATGLILEIIQLLPTFLVEEDK